MSDFKDKKDEIIEEQVAPVEEEKAAEAKPEKAEPKAEKKSQRKSKSADDFISRKLKVINSINNPAKARSLAERVLNNKKGSK